MDGELNPADRPWHRLDALPRELWRWAVVCSSGQPEQRLPDLARWRQALVDGALPPHDADLGDPDASRALRPLLAELELPAHNLPAFGATLYRDPDLVSGFSYLHRLLESPASALQQQTLWREMMFALLQRHAAVATPGQPGREHRAITRAKELMHSQLAAPPSLEALAAAVNLSPFHFARVFRRATGMPPHTWLMQQRIAQARALLQEGCLPLAVATQLGFADQSHLSRQFKKVYGVGPGAYRSARSVAPAAS